MFDPLENVVSWVGSVLSVPVSTYSDTEKATGDEFALVQRTGGDCDYPHDYPEFAIQIWAKSDAAAEQAAYLLAIGSKTVPPTDRHIDAIGVPTMYSFDRQEGGWFVWQVTIPFVVNLLD